MNEGEILRTALSEAFARGRETGEQLERLRVNKTGQDSDLSRCNGFLPSILKDAKITIDPKSALDPESKEILFQVQTLEGERIQAPADNVQPSPYERLLLAQISRLQLDIIEKNKEIHALQMEKERLESLNEVKDGHIAKLKQQLSQE